MPTRFSLLVRFPSAVLLLALLSPPILHAQPRPPTAAGVVRSTVEKVYYEVEGDSPGALAVALRQRGPRARGKRFFAMTAWKVNAEYRWRERPTACAIGDLTVRVAVQMHLPRWRRPRRASPSLDGAWGRFLAALDQHEQGHRALAEEAAEAIRRRLAPLQATTCERVEARAHREMRSLLDEYERHNLAYDEATGHGRTQGATWPPSPWPSGTH
jgi:predicted secreted Zn-dependent protease